MTGASVDPAALALQRLYHWERATPDRVCLTQPYPGAAAHTGAVRDFTWAGMMDEVRRMAAHLVGLGLPRGSPVAILSKNCAHWLMADFAIWMAGHVSVPLYPSLAAGTVRQILEHCEARLLFVGKLDGWEHMREGIPVDLPCIAFPIAPPNDFDAWDAIVARTAPLAGEPLREADELCTLIYTSGTTGQPKGVMHTFGHFAWALSFGLRRVTLDADTRMLSYLPLAHVAERTLVEHGLLAVGGHVYFAESLDTFATDLRRARPTVFFSVPRLWVKFQQGVHASIPPARLARLLGVPLLGRLVRRRVLRGLGLDRCRYAAGGAAPMPPELLAWYERLGLPIIEVYGMTENCAVSHATLPGVPRPGTVGRPYDGVESRLDPVTGEIQMRSGAVMLGYFRAPELTRQAFTEDGWFRTGDKGQLDGEGNLRIVGRVKDLFKTSKGKYVAPAPIEDRLVTHTAVEACCVTGANLSQPLAILMLNAEAVAGVADAGFRATLEQELEAHRQRINDALDPHERLDCLVVVRDAWTVDNDLVTPTLKVKRNRIEDVYGADFERWVAQRRTVVWH